MKLMSFVTRFFTQKRIFLRKKGLKLRKIRCITTNTSIFLQPNNFRLSFN